MTITITTRIRRCFLPPIARHIKPPGAIGKFKDIEIPKITFLPQLRPDGVRQPEAEANILSRMVAVAQGRAPITLDPIGR